MPKWRYFVSLSSVLSACSHDQYSGGERAADGTLLQWDDSTQRLTAVGTPLWWAPADMFKDLLSGTQYSVRLRLMYLHGAYGIHIDLDTTRFFERAASAEMMLSRVLIVQDLLVFRQQTIPLLLDASRSHTHVRRCRKRLTEPQSQALAWMRDLESRSGDCVELDVAIPVPGNRLCFSMSADMFVDQAVGDVRGVTIRAGALMGMRGTGKSQIIRSLLTNPVRSGDLSQNFQSPFPAYNTTSSLLVVPANLVMQWKDALYDIKQRLHVVTTRDAAIAWTDKDLAKQSVVLVTYPVLRAVVAHFRSIYKNSTTDKIQKRRGVRQRSLDAIMWHRIVYDEYGVHSIAHAPAMSNMTARMTWALQGGAASCDECDIVKSLYPDLYPGGELLCNVVYNRLPVIVPLQTVTETHMDLTPTEGERRIFSYGAAGGGGNRDMMYACYNHPSMVRMGSYDDISVAGVEIIERMYQQEEEEEGEEGGEEDEDGDEEVVVGSGDGDDDEDEDEDEDPEMGDDISDDLSWLYPGLVSIVFGEEEEEDEEEGEEESTVVPVRDFFMKQVSGLASMGVLCDGATCSVCLERNCTSVFLCGHTTCSDCMYSILAHDTASRCPHCRYLVKEGEAFTVDEAVVPISASFLARAISDSPPHEKIFILGSNVAGVERLRAQMPPNMPLYTMNDISGRVEMEVAHVFLIDSGASVPVTFTNSGDTICSTRLTVRP